jgi:hypothetical protein
VEIFHSNDDKKKNMVWKKIHSKGYYKQETEQNMFLIQKSIKQA